MAPVRLSCDVVGRWYFNSGGCDPIRDLFTWKLFARGLIPTSSKYGETLMVLYSIVIIVLLWSMCCEGTLTSPGCVLGLPAASVERVCTVACSRYILMAVGASGGLNCE